MALRIQEGNANPDRVDQAAPGVIHQVVPAIWAGLLSAVKGLRDMPALLLKSLTSQIALAETPWGWWHQIRYHFLRMAVNADTPVPFRRIPPSATQETTPPPIFKRRRTMFLKARYSRSWGYGKWHFGTFARAPKYALFADFKELFSVLKTKINIKIDIKSHQSATTPLTSRIRRQKALDAYQRRQGAPIIPKLTKVTLPRQVIKSGLPNRPGLLSLTGEVSLGREDLLLFEWGTSGSELPRDSDWRWYAAITSRCASTFAPQQIRLGSLADLHRLGFDLGCHATGGQMTKRCALAIGRLSQAYFGCSVVLKNASTHPAPPVAPIIEISSGLAQALWPGKVPPGVVACEDPEFWIRLSPEHREILLAGQIIIPGDVFRRLAQNPANLSIALWLVVTAQSAQREYDLDRVVVEDLVTRLTTRPRSATLLAVHEAVHALTKALEDSGFHGSFKVDVVRSRPADKQRPRGRPPIEWTMTIHPAGRPFKTRKPGPPA